MHRIREIVVDSLFEMYGLVGIVGEHILGDIKSFKAQLSRLNSASQLSEKMLIESAKGLAENLTAENHYRLNRTIRNYKKAKSNDYSALKKGVENEMADAFGEISLDVVLWGSCPNSKFHLVQTVKM